MNSNSEFHLLFDFSFIVGSLGRKDELKKLLDALSRQTGCRMELLLIDQSHGELDLQLLENLPFPVQRISAEPGLSHCRNLGMRLAQGNIIAFPDDDCFYPDDLLKNLKQEFENHPEYDGISVKVTDIDGQFSAGGYMASNKCRMTGDNIWRTAVSPSLFFRRDAIQTVRFDEKLGVGSHSPFQSGEETDFCLQLLEKGKNLLYLPQYVVYHPIFKGPFSAGRAWGYGLGMGGVLRKHHYSLFTVYRFAAYQLGRSFQHLLSGNLNRAYYHLKMSLGRVHGFSLWKKYQK